MSAWDRLQCLAPRDDAARLHFFERALELRRAGLSMNEILEQLAGSG